jgi:restriction system protein
MAKRKRSERQLKARGQEFAVTLILAGLAGLVLPFLLSKSPVGQALVFLRPLGLAMIAGGALLFWIFKRQSAARIAQAPAQAVRPTQRAAAAPRFPTPRDVTDVPDQDVARIESAKLEASAAISKASGAAASPAMAWGPEVFSVIEWRRFEAVVEKLFQQAGFETRSQSHGADGGVDVWLHSRHDPGKPISLVQCKHWQGKRVGVDKIRELRGVMAAHDVRRGQFATTSSFTPDAVEFARANSIHLLDVDALLALISQRTPDQQRELLSVAYEGDYSVPTCVNCGVKLTRREPRGGGAAFWGCVNFPKCRTTMPMRGA